MGKIIFAGLLGITSGFISGLVFESGFDESFVLMFIMPGLIFGFAMAIYFYVTKVTHELDKLAIWTAGSGFIYFLVVYVLLGTISEIDSQFIFFVFLGVTG